MSEYSIDLTSILHHKQHDIEHFFRGKWHQNTAPLYGSVDLRHNNYKLTSVDMNLFPGGFNNIDPQGIILSSQAISNLINNYDCQIKKVLLIPENHTRNQAYLKNVYTLYYILEQAGIETRIGSIDPNITNITEVEVIDQKHLIYYPIIREGNKIKTIDGFEACLIILNNDLSNGAPQILHNLQQKILPPLNAGWYMRKKTNFFTQYDFVCDEFAKLLNIDSWFLNAFFDQASNINFTTQDGIDNLATKVANLLQKIQNKYNDYQIKDTPYVVIKANNGTYGMGIMIVQDADEVLNMNRKTKNKMTIIKDGQTVNDVIIQEGVYTTELVQNKTAEPVIYMMGSAVIGGFYRTHSAKNNQQNLNAVGASFAPLTFATNCIKPDKNYKTSSCSQDKLYAYGVIARLSLLASSKELIVYDK